MDKRWALSILSLATAGLAAGDVTDPGPAWLFPAMDNVQAHWRPGLGLAGMAPPERPLLDLATQAVAITSMGIRTWTDKVRTDSLNSTQEHTAFWTETLVPVPGGGLLGFDAYDLREGLAATASNGHRETYESPSGIRFGGAWDLLYPFSPKHWASLGVEAWIPAWSIGETSLRSGLRLGSVFRLDLGVGWREAGVQARQDTLVSAWSDSLEAGSLRRTWDARVGWRIDSLQGQVWGGWRTLDPRGDVARWRQFGRIGFAGAQLQGCLAGLSLDGQVRWESGRERLETVRLEELRGSSLERTSWSASWQLEPLSAWSTGQPRLTIEYAHLDGDETGLRGSDTTWLVALGGGSAPAGASTVTRLGITGQWAVFWRSFRIAPELGWHRIERTGHLAALWTGGLGDLEVAGGRSQADVWVPALQASWKRAGSYWNYHLSRPLNDVVLKMGWRHDILLSQSF